MLRISEIPPQWRTTLAGLALALGGVFLFYWQSIYSMVHIWWRSGTYAHGFLVVPISAWLIWKKRGILSPMVPRPALSLLWVIAGLGAAWLVARSVEVVLVQQLCVVGLLIATTVAVLGWRVSRTIAFPLGFLIFAVPMGESLLSPLMHFTAAFTVKALQLTGIPVFSEGMYITLPNGRWEVAEACSGLRYLIASVTLGFLYAYVMYRSIGRRIIFIIASMIVPIIANGIRAYMVVMIGYLSDMELAVGVDHIIYGWVLFGIIIGIMFYIGSFWREDVEEQPASGHMVDGREANSEHHQRTKVLAITLLSVMMLTALWPALAVKIGGDSRVVPPIKLDTPMPVGSWHLSPLQWDWRPGYLKPQGSLRQSYTSADGVVGLYLEYYRDQRQGAELIDSQNLLVGIKDPVWRMLSNKKTVAQLDGRPVTIREASLDSPSEKLLVWQWYWIDGYPTTNDYLAKLFEAKDKLYEGRTRSASIMLATDYEVHADRARKRLMRFIRDMYPQIEKTLFKDGAASKGVKKPN